MYLKWSKKTITDFSDENINSLYSQGYLFGRTGKGEMYETRSLRIDLSKFELNSENRRILRKTEEVTLEKHPLPYADYHWSIGKLGKDFYTEKFGDGTFSANKIKELMTGAEKSNFNTLLAYSTVIPSERSDEVIDPHERKSRSQQIGYCITLETNEIFHYCYPFYSLQATNYPLPPNLGLGMMTKAIMWAKENGKKYVYLGSFSRPTDTYKLQFEGLEWWDGNGWRNDLEELKKTL